VTLDLKPRLGAENSIIASLATVALVIGVYQSKVGPVSDVHATEAQDHNLMSATRKAGWVALAAVAGVSLLAKDPNILILGGAAIIAEEVCYRHALATSPLTGDLQVAPGAYTPAGGTVFDGAGRFTQVAA
jgi:hypothetical protein